MRTSLRPIVAVLAALFVTESARAQTFNWTNTSGGLFGLASNWSAGGPPAAGNVALFDLTNTYTVIFSNSPTNNAFTIQDGNVTFALSGQTYTLNSGLSEVGGITGQTGRLTLGNGTVNIGGTGLQVGRLTASTGFLTVGTNANLNVTSGSGLSIGASGTGTLTVQGGGAVTTTSFTIGSGASGFGTATVTGIGSSLTASALVMIGSFGSGTLTISGGGTVTAAAAAVLGNQSGSSGLLTVSGAGSRFNVAAGNFSVGGSGQGSLTVSAGGSVTCMPGAPAVGFSASGSGTITVTGIGSTFTGKDTVLGVSGTGRLDVAAGGTVNTSGLFFGTAAGGTGTLTVDGVGSLLRDTSDLTTAFSSTAANTISVTNGGTIQVTGTTLLGATAGAAATTVTVSGAGSRWEAAALRHGVNGTFHSISVANGGSLGATGPVTVAESTGATAAIVVQAGSTFTAAAGLFLGGTTAIAAGAGAQGNHLTFTGGTSTVTGETRVWANGTLQVDGGSFTTTSLTRLGTLQLFNGTLTVSGGNFQNGAAAGNMTIDGNSATALPTLRLSGAGTTSSNIAVMVIGSANKAAVEVSGGAVLSSTGNGILANLAGGNGTVLVTGPGSAWNITSGGAFVGNNGTGTMTIANGGSLTSSSGNIGNTASGLGTATVTGAGSIWNNSTGLTIGSLGVGTLTVADGGTVSTSNTTIVGANPGGRGTLNVSGSGSLLSLNGLFGVGTGGQGTMTVSAGGVVTHASVVTFGGAVSTAVTITGSGSTLTAGGAVTLAGATNPVLTLSNGGTLSANGNLSIGTGAGNRGVMTMNGTAAAVATANILGNVTVGNGTNPSSLNINTGSAFTATGTTTVAANSVIFLLGGSLTTGTLTNNGQFSLIDGTTTITGSAANQWAPSATPLFISGNTAAEFPKMVLSGTGVLNNVSGVFVGTNQRGSLTLSGGHVMNLGANTVEVGSQVGGSGTLTLTGSGTTLTTSQLALGGTTAFVAGNGSGTLNIGPGATVNAGVLHIHAGAAVNLTGGTLTTSGLFIPGTPTFNWTSGTIRHTAGPFPGFHDIVLDMYLGAGHVLKTGQILSNSAGVTTDLDGALTVGGGTLSGSGIRNVATLTVSSGSVNLSGSLLNVAGATTILQGTGNVQTTGGITNIGTFLLNNNTTPSTGGTLSNFGTVRGSGYIGNVLSNTTGGQVQLTTGNRLEFTNTGTHSNAGVINLIGGEVAFLGPVTNVATTGFITGRDAIVRVAGTGITNNGSLGFSNGTVDVFAKVTQNVGGRITVSNGGTANFYDDVTVAGGAANVQATAVGSIVSRAVFFGSYNGGVSGGGAAFLEGDHRPGNSPGLVSFGGDVAYGSNSRLAIELGGLARGTQYDAVDVAGAVALSGQLQLTRINGFTPTVGNTFLLVDKASAGPVTGTFQGLSEGSIFFSDGSNWQISYVGGNGNDVIVSFTPVPEPAFLVFAAVAGLTFASRVRRRQCQS